MTIVDSLRKKFVLVAVLSIVVVIITIYGAIAINLHYRNTYQLSEIAKIISDNELLAYLPDNVPLAYLSREFLLSVLFYGNREKYLDLLMTEISLIMIFFSMIIIHIFLFSKVILINQKCPAK